MFCFKDTYFPRYWGRRTPDLVYLCLKTLLFRNDLIHSLPAELEERLYQIRRELSRRHIRNFDDQSFTQTTDVFDPPLKGVIPFFVTQPSRSVTIEGPGDEWSTSHFCCISSPSFTEYDNLQEYILEYSHLGFYTGHRKGTRVRCLLTYGDLRIATYRESRFGWDETEFRWIEIEDPDWLSVWILAHNPYVDAPPSFQWTPNHRYMWHEIIRNSPYL